MQRQHLPRPAFASIADGTAGGPRAAQPAFPRSSPHRTCGRPAKMGANAPDADIRAGRHQPLRRLTCWRTSLNAVNGLIQIKPLQEPFLTLHSKARRPDRTCAIHEIRFFLRRRPGFFCRLRANHDPHLLGSIECSTVRYLPRSVCANLQTGR